MRAVTVVSPSNPSGAVCGRATGAALLEACAEEIMELDETEVLWYINHLPDLDMGSVVMQAFNLKDDLQQKLL